jgi:hypothetical protein
MEIPHVDWVEVIKVAGRSPLSLVSAVMIGLLVLAVVFFRSASTRAKMVIYALLLLFSGGLLWRLLDTRTELQTVAETVAEMNVHVGAANHEVERFDKWQAANPRATAADRQAELTRHSDALRVEMDQLPPLQDPALAALQADYFKSRDTELAARAAGRPETVALAERTAETARHLADALERSVTGKNVVELKPLIDTRALRAARSPPGG